MSIQFKVIERGQPGVAGGGVKKYYASATISGEKNLVDLTREIEKISTVSGADIRGVLYALVDIMKNSLSEGEVIKLGELGNFRVSISSKGEETPELVKSSSIRGAKVIFSPGKDLRKMLSMLSFKKI